MVSEISALIGKEKATIVVANALRLNGGMIAAAHRAEDGTYSDHGLLTLRVGEFFVQHIHDYDDGYTLGAAIGSDFFAPTVGGHKISGTTFATVGRGTIECTKSGGMCEADSANRDVTHSQERDTEYNVTPITAYIPLGPMPTLPRTPDGRLDWKTMAENVHAQTFGAAATALKLACKPFGLGDQPADEKRAQELKQALDAARAEYDKLSDDEKKIANQYQEKGNQILNKQLAEIHEIASDDKSTDKDTTTPQQSKLAKAMHIAAEGLRKLGSEYSEFEQKYPNLARFGMSGLNVLVQSLVAGVPGLINAAKSEMVGFGIAAATASGINGALHSAADKAYKFIKTEVPDLSDEDARTLATAATVGVAFAVGGALQVRQLMHQLGGLKVGGVGRVSMAMPPSPRKPTALFNEVKTPVKTPSKRIVLDSAAARETRAGTQVSAVIEEAVTAPLQTEAATTKIIIRHPTLEVGMESRREVAKRVVPTLMEPLLPRSESTALNKVASRTM